MGLLTTIKNFCMVARFNTLSEVHASAVKNGHSYEIASAITINAALRLNLDEPGIHRLANVTRRFPDKINVIGFILFIKRSGLLKRVTTNLCIDLLMPEITSCNNLTGIYLSNYGMSLLNEGNNQPTASYDRMGGKINDALFSLYYASFIAPDNILCWALLAKLKHTGVSLKIDDRNYIHEGELACDRLSRLDSSPEIASSIREAQEVFAKLRASKA